MIKNKLFVIPLAIISYFLVSCSSDDSVNPNDLSNEVSDYIEQYFPNEDISEVEIDNDGTDVTLSNGLELEFNYKGDITSIESDDNKALPENVIPDPIEDYIDSHYPNAKIVSWEKDGSNQEVELSNDVTLIFDNNNEFVRVDRD